LHGVKIWNSENLKSWRQQGHETCQISSFSGFQFPGRVGGVKIWHRRVDDDVTAATPVTHLSRAAGMTPAKRGRYVQCTNMSIVEFVIQPEV
jgi:alpha/beta superfamily hydrolase